MLTVDSELIDRHPGLLNVRNGTIELKSSTLLPHDPRHLITRMIDIEYDASVKSDFWEVVLSQVTMETHLTTRPQVKFHKRWYGYCATGETREHKFLVHYGQGSNGKSTILDTVAAVLGEYAVTAPPGLLMASKSDKHPTEIASLFAKRMVTAHESGDGGVLKEDFIKQATGGDVLSARYMRGDFFEFHPTHKLQLVTNYKPIIHGQDNGIWRRILLVSYPARFGTQAEVNSSRAHYVKDTEVAAKLQREHQGVLTWIVEGAKEWYAEGLNEPDAVLAASKDYQSAQDRVTQFVEEMCECDREYSDIMVGQMSVYMHYQMWCKESGFNALSNQKFKTDLERIVPGFRVEFKVARLDGKTQRRVQTCYGLRIIGEYHSCV
jgi:putative DNA primase/helicase